MRSPLFRMDPDPPGDARRFWSFIALATIAVALHAALVLTYVNVPEGTTGVVGFVRGHVARFATVWSYPRLSFDAGDFERLTRGLWLAAWATMAAAAALVHGLHAPERRTHALRVAFTAATVIHVGLVLFMPPVLSGDLYDYAAFGRMVVDAGLNPYEHGAIDLPADPIARLASWPRLPSHYGAVFTWLSAAATWAGGGDPVATAWAFKALAAAMNLATAAVVVELARRRDGVAHATVGALYLFCPLFTFESAGSGHNESTMMMFAVLGLLAWSRGRDIAALLAFMASALVKSVTAVLPLLLVARALRERDRAARLRVVAACGLAALFAVLLHAPFGFAGLFGLGASATLVTQGRALVGGGAPAASMRLTIYAALAAAALLVALRARRPPIEPLAALLSLAFVLVVFDWWFPWYFVPAATLALASPASAYRRPLVAFTCGLGLVATLAYTQLIALPPR